MAIDLEPIEKFDANSVRDEQWYIIQTGGAFYIADYSDNMWHDAATGGRIVNPIAFALINPYVEPDEAADGDTSGEVDGAEAA